MTATEQFIRDAIEGGYRPKNYEDAGKRLAKEAAMWNVPEILLDPNAWRAVGKVRGWVDELRECGCCKKVPEYCRCCDFEMFDQWRLNMHRMIDALAEGKSADEYLATLQ